MASKVNLKKGGVTAELYTKEAVDTLLGKKADTASLGTAAEKGVDTIILRGTLNTESSPNLPTTNAVTQYVKDSLKRANLKGADGKDGRDGEDGIGGIIKFEVVNGELIMYYATAQKPEIYLVSKDPNSDSYYGKLGLDASLVGHVVFLYQS